MVPQSTMITEDERRGGNEKKGKREKDQENKKKLKKGEKESGGQATKARHAETGTDFDLVRKKKETRNIFSSIVISCECTL